MNMLSDFKQDIVHPILFIFVRPKMLVNDLEDLIYDHFVDFKSILEVVMPFFMFTFFEQTDNELLRW